MSAEEEFSDTPESEPVKTGHWRRRVDGADRNTYRVLRQHFRNQCMARRDVCWICEGSVDYSLRYPDPMSFSLDHAVPVSVDESLALVPTNFRCSHLQHNQMRAAGGVEFSGYLEGQEPELWPLAVVDGMEIHYDPDLGVPSEVW